MSRSGSITLDFAGDAQVFRLPWGQLVELQELCDAGPYVIFDRLRSSRWLLQDVRETIRLGLIGGGKTPIEAIALVRRYVENIEQFPPAENALLAVAILGAAILGVKEEKPGEADAANQDEPPSTISQGEKSDLPQFTETVL